MSREIVAVGSQADFEVLAACEQAEQTRPKHLPCILRLALEQARQLAHLALGVGDGFFEPSQPRMMHWPPLRVASGPSFLAASLSKVITWMTTALRRVRERPVPGRRRT